MVGGKAKSLTVLSWLVLVWLVSMLDSTQSACSKRDSRAAGIICTQACSTQRKCKSDETCLCDGLCGRSCVKNGLTCSSRPPSILNTIELYTGTGFGDTITYTCKDGYTLSGNSKRTCRGNGKWDGTSPACHQLCSPPKLPVSVKITDPNPAKDSYFELEEITIACKPGYKPKGRPVMICVGGSWASFGFDCEAIAPCRRTSETADTDCAKECTPGKGDCAGIVNATCLCDGECGFSCVDKGISCGKPPDVSNGYHNVNSTSYNSTARYYCNESYYFDTKHTVKRCTAKKVWNGPKPRCLPCCLTPDTMPPNASIPNPKKCYKSIEQVTFKCNDGYTMKGSATKMCIFREWYGTVTCIVSGCGDPGIPVNGERIGDQFFPKHQVFFSCNRGYVLHGSGSRTCQDDRTWSGTQPTCHEQSRIPSVKSVNVPLGR